MKEKREEEFNYCYGHLNELIRIDRVKKKVTHLV
jgi:hypothetical protein